MFMRRIHNLGFHIMALLFSLFFLFPFYWVVISITKDVSQLYEGTFLPGVPNHIVDNLVGVFAYKHAVFLNWLGNSFLFATVGALIGTFFAALAGYAFRRYTFAGRKLLYILILGFSMVPAFATILPLFIVFKNLGLLDTRWCIIIPSLVNVFGVYLMIMYFNQIPQEIFDAAMIDGAGDGSIFFKIGLPSILSGFTTLVLLSFVGIWNNYFLPLVLLNSSEKFPLIIGITTISSLQGFPIYSLVVMGAFLTSMPLLILFLAGQRFLAPQLTGAIK
jgi:multiple sugar transport system permease protein